MYVLSFEYNYSAFMRLIPVLDKNVIAGVSGDHGVPSESNDWSVGSTIHPTTGASSCVGQDKRSTPASQQQDNGRSGGSSDSANNTGSIKGYHSNHTWFIHSLRHMKYLTSVCTNVIFTVHVTSHAL